MQQSSLDILSDLLQRYIGEIGRSAHCYAETCSRGTPSAEDLVTWTCHKTLFVVSHMTYGQSPLHHGVLDFGADPS